MNISAGATLGRYEIRSKISAGGSEVFRARDFWRKCDTAATLLTKDGKPTSTGVKLLAIKDRARHGTAVKLKAQRSGDLAARIYRQLAGARGLDDAERWQHALFFAMSPQERCHFSLKTARSALSLKRSAKKK